MINLPGGGDQTRFTAFPRLAKPPVPPRPRDHMSPGVSPIAHRIAAQILNNHLNHPQAGIANAAQNGLLAGQATGQKALLNNLMGMGTNPSPLFGGLPVSLSSVQPGYTPPTSPFGLAY